MRVNRGDTVIIRLESADVVHGLYVDGYGVATAGRAGPAGRAALRRRPRRAPSACAVGRVRQPAPVHDRQARRRPEPDLAARGRRHADHGGRRAGRLLEDADALRHFARSRSSSACSAAAGCSGPGRAHAALLRAGDPRRAVRHAGGQPQLRHRLRLDRLVGAADPGPRAVRGPAVVRRLPHPRAGRMAPAPRPGRSRGRAASSTRWACKWPRRFRNIWLQNIGFLGVALFSSGDPDHAPGHRARAARLRARRHRHQPALRAAHLLPLPLPGRRLHRAVQPGRAGRDARQGPRRSARTTARRPATPAATTATAAPGWSSPAT